MTKYKGKIFYKINEEHIDYEFKYKDKPLLFEDIYYINREQFYSDDEEEIKSYIKNDLLIVAGGGYSDKDIYDTFIYIEKI